MKFIIRVGSAFYVHKKRCPSNIAPTAYFAQCVKRAVERGDLSVELIKVYTAGCEHVLESWSNDAVSKPAIYKYKIHSLPTAQKGNAGRSNDTYYATEAEALEKATSYVTRSVNPQSMVIYKAIKIVRAADRPILVEDID